MRLTKFTLSACIALGVVQGIKAQIINSTQPETTIAGYQANTGLAIAPNYNLQAAVLSDGTGTWTIDWIEASSGTIVDSDVGAGLDADVAYYADESAVVVAYEKANAIYVNDYSLTTLPFDYTLNAMNFIDDGTHANIDMNSLGRGILCWVKGDDVMVSTFTLSPFTLDPPVPVGNGTMPDVIALDDGQTAVVTYVDFSGNLVIDEMDYGLLTSGVYSSINFSIYAATNGFRNPRIAGQRNSNFGPADDFGVVTQTWNGFSDDVQAFFGTGGSVLGPFLVNSQFTGCVTVDPYPVIAYNRNRANIVWSQNYTGGCTTLTQSSPNFEDDILLKSFNPSTGGTTATIEEVNQFQNNYALKSRHSISTEYDGFFLITGTNWSEGMIFEDASDLYWKRRNSGTPSYIDEHNTISEARDNNFSLVSSPVDQTIEVLSESDELASFQLLDNAGRIVELKGISNSDNIYSIDISHLSGGMYFLHCSSSAGQEVLRVLQVQK